MSELIITTEAVSESDNYDINHLYHYYEKGQTPFRSVTALPFDEAVNVLEALREKNENLVHPNLEWFLRWRYGMEKTLRDEFIAIGGKPERLAPVYCSLGANTGISTWFVNPVVIRIPVKAIDLDAVSFTYGDTLPVFDSKLNKGEEWWGKVFKYDGILRILDKYGYPDDLEYNIVKGIYPKDKTFGSYLKYIEAHVWSDDVFKDYI